MAKIRIKSNPYKRDIVFAIYQESDGGWKEINEENNPNSKLITDSIKKGFLPFKVKEIVDVLCEEYIAGDEELKLYFEGTADEFIEMEEICNKYDSIKLEKADVFLQNARDIVPKIRGIFTCVNPIVEKYITSQKTKNLIIKNTEKFIDASNDIVPICVIGNYSSGKSTFINALMGMEILPSGDMPITAKVYKIEQTDDDEIPNICFEYKDAKVQVSFGENIEIDATEVEGLKERLLEIMADVADESVASKMRECLEFINSQKEEVSDLVEINVGFAESPLKESKNSFVIFDTPGSNTATHREHLEILRDAMKDLSNGVPIYVAEYNTLDSCDNENLYEEIKSISQIDSRFTMIVVNKADSAGLEGDCFDAEKEEAILRQAVPSNLYSGGIYFVSSVMGLGSKNQGKFANDHCDEIFEDNERKYSDPESKRYKSLYKFNIMPEQIKDSIVQASLACDNRILANSGMYALEGEIVNFAEKYSAYDKCNQSDKYIGRIIEAAQDEIDGIRKQNAIEKKVLEDELEEGRKELIWHVEEGSENLIETYENNYDSYMEAILGNVEFAYKLDEIRKREAILKNENREEYDLQSKRAELKDSGEALLHDVIAISEKPVKEILHNISADVKTIIDNAKTAGTTKWESDNEAADELINELTQDFNKRLDEATDSIDAESKAYWEANAENTKKELATIITQAEVLDAEKRSELEEIIINYGNVCFKNNFIFKKRSFELKLKILKLEIDLNRLNILKLTSTYNKNYSNNLFNIYEEIKNRHGKSFENWCEELVGVIRQNIVDYSPILSEQDKAIREKTKLIAELTEAVDTLETYEKEIRELMSWTTAE